MGAAFAFYNRLQLGQLHSLGQWSTPLDYVPVVPAQGHLCHDVIRSDDDGARVIRNLASTPYMTTDPHVAKYGLATYVGHPVQLGGRHAGALCAVYRDDFVPSETDLGLLGILATAIGIEEERHAAEEALREREQFTRAVFDSAQVGILVSDAATGAVIEANNAAAELLGLVRDEIIGSSTARFVRPGEQNLPQHSASPVGAVGTQRTVLRPDGREVPVLATAVATSLHGRRHLIECFVDISLKQQMEDELRAAVRAAEVASAAKGEFLANMSHEIRTPLNGVIGMSQLLLETALDERQQRYAETVARSGEILLSVINDVLDFSKIEAGRMELERQCFGLPELVENTADTFTYQASSRGLELVVDVSADVPERVLADHTRLRQVLCNLVGNAIKFTHHGQVVVKCALEGYRGDLALVRFEVSDTGIGLAPDRRHRLFSPFSQLDASTTREYGGTGLGLAICRHLVDAMDGEIDVESEVGVGSTFHFTLPLPVSEAPAPRALWEDGELAGERVLILDGNAASREVLARILRRLGIACETTGSATDAVDLLAEAARAEHPFTAGLLDRASVSAATASLPRLLREAAGPGSLRLGLMAGIDRMPPEEELRAAGFEASLAKPFHRQRVREMLRRLGGLEDLAPTAADRAPAPAGEGRILLAEDNEVNQMVVSEILRQHGYSCDVVDNGVEALRALRSAHYDLLLLDCQMPEMDGYEAARRIRAAEQVSGEHLWIVALTANATREVERRCVEVGMDVFVSKPVDPARLLAVLADALATPEQVAEPAAPEAAVAAPEEIVDFDHGQLLRMVGGRIDLAVRVLERFRTELETDRSELSRHLAENNPTALGRAAHRLKGAAATVGAEGIRAVAEQLQHLGDAGEMHDVPELLEALRRRCRRFVDFILSHPLEGSGATSTPAA